MPTPCSHGVGICHWGARKKEKGGCNPPSPSPLCGGHSQQIDRCRSIHALAAQPRAALDRFASPFRSSLAGAFAVSTGVSTCEWAARSAPPRRQGDPAVGGICMHGLCVRRTSLTDLRFVMLSTCNLNTIPEQRNGSYVARQRLVNVPVVSKGHLFRGVSRQGGCTSWQSGVSVYKIRGPAMRERPHFHQSAVQ